MGLNWAYVQCCPGGLQGTFSFPSQNIGYSAGYGKIYKSTNQGNNWFDISAFFTNIVYYDIEFFNDSIGFCVGDQGTILKTTNGGITSVKPAGNTIPKSFNLYQNYPNPFNPSTQIKFDVPKSSFVQLVVYDALGREVAVLVNEKLTPGFYDYQWNAELYTSGIYFYKLAADDFSETKKMVLIK
jgi:hypothetical protein